MRYYKQTQDDYIAAVGTGPGCEEITREEYENILSIIRDRPEPDEGYTYRLRTDLTWALVEAPVEDSDPEATVEDYQAALADLGVSV